MLSAASPSLLSPSLSLTAGGPPASLPGRGTEATFVLDLPVAPDAPGIAAILPQPTILPGLPGQPGLPALEEAPEIPSILPGLPAGRQPVAADGAPLPDISLPELAGPMPRTGPGLPKGVLDCPVAPTFPSADRPRASPLPASPFPASLPRPIFASPIARFLPDEGVGTLPVAPEGADKAGTLPRPIVAKPIAPAAAVPLMPVIVANPIAPTDTGETANLIPVAANPIASAEPEEVAPLPLPTPILAKPILPKPILAKLPEPIRPAPTEPPLTFEVRGDPQPADADPVEDAAPSQHELEVERDTLPVVPDAVRTTVPEPAPVPPAEPSRVAAEPPAADRAAASDVQPPSPPITAASPPSIAVLPAAEQVVATMAAPAAEPAAVAVTPRQERTPSPEKVAPAMPQPSNGAPVPPDMPPVGQRPNAEAPVPEAALPEAAVARAVAVGDAIPTADAPKPSAPMQVQDVARAIPVATLPRAGAPASPKPAQASPVVPETPIVARPTLSPAAKVRSAGSDRPTVSLAEPVATRGPVAPAAQAAPTIAAAAPAIAAAPSPVRPVTPVAAAPVAEQQVAPDRPADVPARTVAAPAATAAPSALPEAALRPAAAPAREVFAAAIERSRRTPAAASASGTSTAPVEMLAPATPAAIRPVSQAQDVPLDMTATRWTEDMVSRIERMLDRADANDGRIRLRPDALGNVDLTVRQDGGQVHVHFRAEVAETRQMLRDAAPRLADAAEARGLQLGDASVSGGSPQQEQGRQRDARPSAAPLPNRRASQDASAETSPQNRPEHWLA